MTTFIIKENLGVSGNTSGFKLIIDSLSMIGRGRFLGSLLIGHWSGNGIVKALLI